MREIYFLLGLISHSYFNCNFYSAIPEAVKSKVKVTVETVTLQVNKDKENMQEKTTKVEHTLFQKTEQRKRSEDKETNTKSKVVATNAKSGLVKTQANRKLLLRKQLVKTRRVPQRPVAQLLVKFC